MLELYQAEWCPSSSRVRRRLTELGIDFVARQVPAARGERARLTKLAGTDSIPALVCEDSTVLVGEAEITSYLDRRFTEPLGALAHRLKAEEMRMRQLADAPVGGSSP